VLQQSSAAWEFAQKSAKVYLRSAVFLGLVGLVFAAFTFVVEFPVMRVLFGVLGGVFLFAAVWNYRAARAMQHR